MDIFAHGLWGYAILYKNRRNAWLGALFGVLPDIIPFAPAFIMRILSGDFQGRPRLSSLPEWTFSAYNVTHSLVAFAAVFLLVYAITKKWFWPLIAWGFHILSDIPTHTTRFFATPFLWPISDIRYNGISWGTPWFMALNYAAILAVFIFIARERGKERKASAKFKKH